LSRTRLPIPPHAHFYEAFTPGRRILRTV